MAGVGNIRQLARRADDRLADDVDRLGVLDHEGDAVGRVVGVERQVRGPRPVHGQQGDHEFDRSGQRDGHRTLGARAHSGQRAGGAFDFGVQFGVREAAVLEDQCLRIRSACDLGAEQLLKGGRRDPMAGGVPGGEHLVAFVLGKNVQVANGRGRNGDDLLQQPEQPLGHALDRGPVEQVGAVLDPTVQAALALDEVEAQVELGGLLADGLPGDGQAREVEGGVLARQVDDHDLEEGMAGEGAFGVERLHQDVEGQVLVVVGGQVGLAYPAEQVLEARRAGHVRTQHQGVHEEADQVFQVLLVPSGDRRAEGDVVARAEPVQQRRHRGLDDHEHAHAVGQGEPAQTACQLGADPESGHSPALTSIIGAWPIHGQHQLVGKPGEGLPPVVEMAVLDLVPERVVRVLHRQRGPAGGLPRHPAPVRLGQVAS